MKTIKITTEGGVIQDINDIPDDVQVVVRDYDVDGSEYNLMVDECGHNFIESVWAKFSDAVVNCDLCEEEINKDDATHGLRKRLLRKHKPGIANMLELDDLSDTDLIEHDREEQRAELKRAAAEIDGEIKNLEEATAVTREVLKLEFTV